ncbi:unnamed protein product, partial [marine sediment metagenome]
DKEIISIIEALDEKFTEAFEAVNDRIDEIEKAQSLQGRSPITRNLEPSPRDLEIIESQFEQIGLCGEIRKVIRDPYIQGKGEFRP